jgi:hypothetical protein
MSTHDEIETYEPGLIDTLIVDGICQIERRGPLVFVALGELEMMLEGHKLRRTVIKLAMLNSDAIRIAERILATAHKPSCEVVELRPGMH